MSRLEKLLAGWTFRTATPSFEAGEVITAYLTHRDADGFSVRIGDSIIRVGDVDDVSVETKVRLKVTSFDDATNEGTGDVVDVLGTDD